MFEDDSDLSSSEEEPDEDAYVVCAAQNATDKRRQKNLMPGGYILRTDMYRSEGTVSIASLGRPSTCSIGG